MTRPGPASRELRAVVIAAASLVAASCGSSSEVQTQTSPSATKCGVQLTRDSSAFPSSGGSAVLRITAARECPWSAQSGAPWLTLASPVNGQGEGSVRFTVGANAEPSARTADISVNDQRAQISQEGKPCQFTVSSNHESVDGAGGDRTINVRTSGTQCDWTAAANVSWINIMSGRAGRGNGTVTFRVEPVSGPPRIGSITVAAQTVQVDQGTGCSYALASDAVAVDASGGERQIAVTAPAGCPWTAESQTPWITITGGSTSTGPGAAVFRVAASDAPSRTGTLRVAGRTVTVTQTSGCAFSVSPDALNVGAAGATSSVQVQTASGCAWSASSGAEWITVTGGTSATGPGQVQVTVAPNVAPARSGSVTIAGQTVQVAQASGCTYVVSPTPQEVAASGGTATISIATAAGCSWTARSGADWIAVSDTSGAGPTQLTYTVSPNAGPPRSGSITVAGQAIAVNQLSECTWAFNPPFHEFGPDGGFGTVLVFVTGQCTWTTVSDVDWIQIVAGDSGVGGGLFQFTAAPNPGGARSGTITVGGQKYVVNEAGR